MENLSAFKVTVKVGRRTLSFIRFAPSLEAVVVDAHRVLSQDFARTQAKLLSVEPTLDPRVTS